MAKGFQTQRTDPFVDTVIDNRYVILDKINDSGRGVIYRGESTMTGWTIALKLVDPNTVAASTAMSTTVWTRFIVDSPAGFGGNFPGDRWMAFSAIPDSSGR